MTRCGSPRLLAQTYDTPDVWRCIASHCCHLCFVQPDFMASMNSSNCLLSRICLTSCGAAERHMGCRPYTHITLQALHCLVVSSSSTLSESRLHAALRSVHCLIPRLICTPMTSATRDPCISARSRKRMTG